MSNKKTWESLASEAAKQIDQWRARAEVAEARVAELECELADAESITLGALDAALANGEERDSEKVRREAAEARVAELESLLAPVGDYHDRLLRLVEIAKRLGFKNPDPAYWPDSNMETPLCELQDLAFELSAGDSDRLHLGIFLNESVTATVRVDPDDEDELVVDASDYDQALAGRKEG